MPNVAALHDGELFLARRDAGVVVVARAAFDGGLGAWSEVTAAVEVEGTAAWVSTGDRLALWLRTGDRAHGAWWDDETASLTPFGDFAPPVYGPVATRTGPQVLDGDGMQWRLDPLAAERTNYTTRGRGMR